MNRIAMASIDNIVRVAKKNSKPLGENLDYYTSYYENDMNSLIRKTKNHPY